MPTHYTDTHAHLYADEFRLDRDDMMRRADEVGVTKMFMPNIDHTSIDSMLEMEAKYTGKCFAMMGLHPCSVKKDFEKELYIVEQWLSKRKFLAIGEMGTDLHWDKTFWGQQQEAFIIQVNWAKKYQLPVVVHCRESLDQTLEILEPLANAKLTGVFHCFSGTAEQAKRIMSMGFLLGIGGVVTFKNSGLDKVLPEVPIDGFVLETDCPYLAPVPHRGKRNEPSFIPIVAEKVAGYLQVTVEELQEKTTLNARKVFGMV